MSQQYRALEASDVPKELDERVLARAADAVRSSGEKAHAWRRWSVPVAFAASTVLVVSIVLEGGVQESVMTRSAAPSHAESEVREPAPAPMELSGTPQPAPVAEDHAPAPPPPDPVIVRERSAPRAESPAIASEKRAIDSSKSERIETFAARSAAEARVKAAEQELPASAREPAMPIAETAANARSERGMRAAFPPAQLQDSGGAAYAVPALESQPVMVEAERWLERIRALRENGKDEEADREWQAFRKAYPDHPVEEEDAARPEW